DIVAIPFAMAFDVFDTDEMVDEFGELSDAIVKLHDGVGKLTDGVRELNEGTGDLYAGSTKFQQGLVDLNSASGSLVNGSAQIKRALGMIKEELSFLDEMDLSNIGELTDGLSEMEKEFRKTAKELEELAAQYAKAYRELKRVADGIPAIDDRSQLTPNDLEAIQQVISPEKIETLTKNIQAAQAIKMMFITK